MPLERRCAGGIPGPDTQIRGQGLGRFTRGSRRLNTIEIRISGNEHPQNRHRFFPLEKQMIQQAVSPVVLSLQQRLGQIEYRCFQILGRGGFDHLPGDLFDLALSALQCECAELIQLTQELVQSLPALFEKQAGVFRAQAAAPP